MLKALRRHHELVVLALSVILLAGGAVAWWSGAEAVADGLWVAGTVLGLVFALLAMGEALRDRRPTVDVIAVLALAGALCGGRAARRRDHHRRCSPPGRLLEERAAARARRELSLLTARAPRRARRLTADGLVEVPVEEIEIGDRLLVATGEVVPVDGRLVAAGTFDESALTGEPVPVERPAGDDVRRAWSTPGRPSSSSRRPRRRPRRTPALVRLVGEAQATSAPFVRVADRGPSRSCR